MKAPVLKVYGCTRHRAECPKGQTREVVAATSKAAARRAFEALGANMRSVELGTTGNDVELQHCLAEPGVVFWRPNDSGWPRRYVRHGESWTGRPTWEDSRSGGSTSVKHGVRLSVAFTKDGGVRGYMGHVIVDEVSTPGSVLTAERDACLRDTEALARRVVRERIAELEQALAWLGPEPEPTACPAKPTP